MAKYPLAPLLSARKFREDALARAVSAARRDLEVALQTEVTVKEELNRYQAWRPKEEARLFEELRGKILPQLELDKHRDDLHGIREGETQREEACIAAASAVKTAEAKVEEARQQHLIALRGREKIEAHKDIWRREEAKRSIAAEEAEAEDFPLRQEETDEENP